MVGLKFNLVEVFGYCTVVDGEMIVLNDELDIGMFYLLIYTKEMYEEEASLPTTLQVYGA